MKTLLKMTPRLRKALKHSFTYCDFDGRLVPHRLQSENLFEVIHGMKRFIVDSNASWRAEAAKPKNKDVAFILGRTLNDETDNLKSLFFSEKVNLSNNNLFLFGIDDLMGPKLVKLQRLDEPFSLVLDMEGMEEESKPRQHRTDPVFKARRVRQLASIEEAKREILRLLKVKSIEELPKKNALASLQAELQNFITGAAPLCHLHWGNSIEVACHCYALLVIQDRQIRNEFAKSASDYPNVLGDTALVQNALFLRAGILSDDFAPKKMTSYIGLTEMVCQPRP